MCVKTHADEKLKAFFCGVDVKIEIWDEVAKRNKVKSSKSIEQLFQFMRLNESLTKLRVKFHEQVNHIESDDILK